MEIFGKPLKTRVTRNRVTRIRVTRGLAVLVHNCLEYGMASERIPNPVFLFMKMCTKC